MKRLLVGIAVVVVTYIILAYIVLPAAWNSL